MYDSPTLPAAQPPGSTLEDAMPTMRVKLMRAAAAAAAALTMLTACGGGDASSAGGGGNGPADARVVVSTANSFEFLPAEFGLKLGVWKNRRLNVTNTYVSGGQYGQALASGGFDVGMGAVTSLGAITSGVEAPIVSEIGRDFKMMVLVVGNNSNIRSAADLRGKKVGITSVGSVTDGLVQVLRNSQGWSNGDLVAAPVGGFDQQLAALNSGATDAFIWTAEAGFQLEEQGKGKVLFNFGDYVKDSVFEAMNATQSAIDDRPQVVRSYLEGWYETVDYMKKHKDETVKFMSQQFKVSENVAAKTYDLDIANLSSDGTIPSPNLQGIARFNVYIGVVKSPPPVDSYFNGSFVPVKWQPTLTGQ
jgi:ABC-type nitrate/sulfonate/bicarbonate transport system substrate-binding protein